jgi:hypothetical protein
MLADLLHNLTHQHSCLSKAGVGELVVCGQRRPRGKVTAAFFTPALDGAGTHPIMLHKGDEVGMRLLLNIAENATSPFEAMAMIRAQGR